MLMIVSTSDLKEQFDARCLRKAMKGYVNDSFNERFEKAI
jgi:hypothetical protein